MTKIAALSLLSLLVACASPITGPGSSGPGAGADASPGQGSGSPGSPGSGSSTIPDVTCTGAPDAGSATGFRNSSSNLVVQAGAPAHRGIDLITGADADPQVLAGVAAYGSVDKALEDEDVDVFACVGGQWQKLGTATTDGEGTFTLSLAGANRLPVALRDMYMSIAGDRTGTAFLAFVAPTGTAVAVSDVDGTITSSEDAFAESQVSGATVGIKAGAPAAFADLASRGYPIVYLTSRPDSDTDATRSYLAANAMPRAPMRLSPSLVLPGDATEQFKASALAALHGLALAVGIGNRQTDIDAYTGANIPAADILINTVDFPDEVQPAIAAKQATGFSSYDALRTAVIDQLPAK